MLKKEQMLNIRNFYFNSIRTRCCVVWDDASGECAIVDPGCSDADELDAITSLVASEKLTPEKILLTHGHFDHIFGVEPLVKIYGLPVYMHRADLPIVASAVDDAARFRIKSLGDFDFRTTDINDGDVLAVGPTIKLKVITTPGHTPGGVCYYDEEHSVLFAGDTLFAGSIGRTDLRGGDYDSLIKSIMDKLMGLPGEVTVLPGHGPASTIGREAVTNPFLIPFNEPDTDWDSLEGLDIK